MNYVLPQLPYDYDALEPYVDTATMRLHHDKHHAAYVKNLNELLERANVAGEGPIGEFIATMRWKHIPAEFVDAIRFNGGGHHNHAFFFGLLAPAGSSSPSEALLDAISRSFGSFGEFKEAFEKSAMAHLGSGWNWLCVDPEAKEAEKGNMFICSTLNHDSPNMDGHAERFGVPILTLDLWEHAYYLKYNNRKAEYVRNFWEIINWTTVSKNLRSTSAT